MIDDLAIGWLNDDFRIVRSDRPSIRSDRRSIKSLDLQVIDCPIDRQIIDHPFIDS
jgi:hypothetical protein